MTMYIIRYSSDHYEEVYPTQEEWEDAIDETTQALPFDIDIDWNTYIATVDDGDYEDEE